MVSVSAVKGIVKGVASALGHTASQKAVPAAESIFVNGIKSASQIAETTPVIFNNKFFKTLAQDVFEAERKMAPIEMMSGDVAEFLSQSKPGAAITGLKKMFKKVSAKAEKASFLGLNRQTIERLNKLPDEEFLQEAITFVFNNYAKNGQKIPKELMPKVMKYNLNGLAMAYEPMQNLLLIDAGLKLNDRAMVLGLIKHEFTHMWQVLDIFRTKSLGEKFSRYAAQVTAKNICSQLRMMAQLPQEEFAKFIFNPNFGIMQQYRQYLVTSPEAAEQFMNTVFQNTQKTLLTANEQKRMFIINTLGSIAENSPKGKFAKLYFRYFKKGTSLDVMTDVEKFKKYQGELAEQLANTQTILGTAEYLFPELNALCG